MNDVTVHIIVKNEEQWVWYAIASVIEYVGKILIYDTGSTDQTIELIRLFDSKKIILRQCGDTTSENLTKLRNQQIEETRTKWFMLLDGDEVWPKKTMEEFKAKISNSQEKTTGIVVPSVVPVGNLFHYQPEKAGKYQLLGKIGHMNLRGYRKSRRYYWKGAFPLEAYVDKDQIPIQDKPQELVILNNSYWHLTHLMRSKMDTHSKRKLEIGEIRNEVLPEVFFGIRLKSWATFFE